MEKEACTCIKKMSTQIESIERLLNNIKFCRYVVNFNDYTKLLAENIDIITIIISIKDSVRKGAHELTALFSILGLNTKILDTFRCSYAAIIVNGSVIDEKMADSRRDAIKCKVNNIEAFSSSFDSGNRASILFGGKEYSQNQRGFNFVIIESKNSQVIDSFYIDTFSNNIAIKRNIYIEEIDFLLTVNKAIKSIKDKSVEIYEHFLNSYSRSKNKDLEITKIDFFKSIPRANGMIRLNQMVCAYLLSRINDVCNTIGIQYWLHAGSLLGAFRHEGFIPWDDDIDIAMMLDDTLRLHKYLNSEEGQNYFPGMRINLRINPKEMVMKFRYSINGKQFPQSIDIVSMMYIDKNEKSVSKKIENMKIDFHNKIKNECNLNILHNNEISTDCFLKQTHAYFNDIKNLLNPEGKRDFVFYDPLFPKFIIFPTEIIFPIRYTKFENMKLPIPLDIRKYLEIRYGEIYRLPFDIFGHDHINKNRNNILPFIQLIRFQNEEYYKNYIEKELKINFKE